MSFGSRLATTSSALIACFVSACIGGQTGGGTRELECVFLLPAMGTGEAVCEDDEWPFASVSIDATVSMKIESAPRTLELELESPGGDTRELTIRPRYESSVVCGATYYRGRELISLDDD